MPSILVALLICVHCGKAPGPLPAVQIGSIRITATGSSVIDSIRIFLDDRDMGRHKNPATLTSVAAGIHRLFLYIGSTATAPVQVEVKRGETAPVTVVFNPGPYPGNPALLFAVKDTKGDSISLSEQRGKVVLLLFFEHT
ncbi:MAG TPA: hypothetical protein VGB38_00640 [bacterium]